MELLLRAYQAPAAAKLFQTPHRIRDNQHFLLNGRSMRVLLTQQGQRTEQGSAAAQSIVC